MEQLKTIGRELAMGSQGGWGQTKEFLDLVRSIGECRSKAEEDRIVIREIDLLKRHINSPDVPRRKMKEYILRLVYVEMLGHDASFGHIHALKITHDDSLLLKRTGYLAVTLFLNEDHDLIILLVNTIQKDLRSDNYLIVCAALTVVCKLINEETIPAVLPQVVELLAHPKEAVRKKAVMALHRFHRKSSAAVAHITSNFRKRLCDNDPGVMGATLCPLFDLITEDASSYKDLVISFVSILKQVVERRLPKAYDYHQMPAPFIQIRLLKILALLGNGDKQASEGMYTVLADIFRKSESSSNIGNAVLYECICCVSAINPQNKLLETAAEATSRFLKSESHNLKYMGIDALGRLLKINPEIAEQHQLAVIDCLEDPDDTLKRKTFELLYKMTKSSNVEVIVDRMIDYMISITDNHYKTEIASRCVELAEQFAPSNHWFIRTMNKVFEHAGDLVNVQVAHNLMRLIAEGFGEDDDGADSQLRSSAVSSYVQILAEPKLPSLFLQVICWVLGEYGTADGKFSASYITGKLCDISEAHPNNDTVKAYAITAIMKLYAFEMAAGRKVDLLPECQSFVDELSASHSTDLQQRSYELEAMLHLNTNAVENIIPFDASCEDIEVDRSLHFLDAYVQQSLENGANPYLAENERSGMFNTDNFKNQERDPSAHTLRFEAYELPKHSPVKTSIPVASMSDLVPVSEPIYSKEAMQPSNLPIVTDVSSTDDGVRLRLDGVQKKWVRPVYSSPSAPSSSTSNGQKAANGVTSIDAVGPISSATQDLSYDSRKPQVQISDEKQRLAASLFGTTQHKTERKTSRSSHAQAEKQTSTAKSVAPTLSSQEKAQPSGPPPNLLDLGEPALESAPSITKPRDPFEQLEGLLDSGTLTPSADTSAVTVTKPPDLLGLPNGPILDMSSGPASSVLTNIIDSTESSREEKKPGGIGALKKGPDTQASLEKFATARQVGVTPSGENPNLFRDLLG